MITLVSNRSSLQHDAFLKIFISLNLVLSRFLFILWCEPFAPPVNEVRETIVQDGTSCDGDDAEAESFQRVGHPISEIVEWLSIVELSAKVDEHVQITSEHHLGHILSEEAHIGQENVGRGGDEWHRVERDHVHHYLPRVPVPAHWCNLWPEDALEQWPNSDIK